MAKKPPDDSGTDANPNASQVPPPTPIRRTCGTMQVHERMLRTMPGYREARDLSENNALRAAIFPSQRTGCTKIPVVVHVVYKMAAQNISDDQIKSQIAVLTADFRKKNTDIGSVPAPFSPLAADARIEFELAKTDPAGNASTGITRTSTNVNSFVDDDAVKSSATGGADAWPADKYLNIWVCPLGNNLLGYAQFPGGLAATDGVVILHSAFGTTGTAAAPFNLGRTATHEVGHWLNLRHIWGDDGSGCAGSDFVADTPNQASENVGTPAFPHVSCGNGPNGDMFMNYMDYVDDVAMMMFTAGQVTRMQATLDGLRSTIGTSISCGKTIHKEIIKEFAKEHPKDFVKDRPKDFPKEFVKELAKDPVFEPGKSFIADLPPKSVFDPPKSFLEPPIDFPFPEGGPGGPFIGRGPYGGGAMPFVLATGSGASAEASPETAAVAQAYLALLGHYARLYAYGQLDAAGMQAWQAAMAAYQRLTGS